MADTFQSSADESRFNMGLATLERIHRLLTTSHEASLGVSQLADTDSSEQKRLQLMVLDRIYLEIRSYLKDAEKKGINSKRKEVNQKFSTLDKKEWSNLYSDLLEYETLLRETHFFKNMLMPKADDPEMAFRG